MTLIKASEGSITIKQQWESMSSSAIIWHIQNVNLPTVDCIVDVQMTGKVVGNWIDIPTGEINVVKTESTTFNGNAGGAVWHIQTDDGSGIYLGLAWGDPILGDPYYNLSSGWGNASGQSYVHESMKDWWDFPVTDWPLKTEKADTKAWVQNGVYVEVQSGANPFQLKFKKATPEEIANLDVGVTPFFHNSKL